jgi:hypothetical protein
MLEKHMLGHISSRSSALFTTSFTKTDVIGVPHLEFSPSLSLLCASYQQENDAPPVQPSDTSPFTCPFNHELIFRHAAQLAQPFSP